MTGETPFKRIDLRDGITLFHHRSRKWTTEVLKLVFVDDLDERVAARSLGAYLLRHGHEKLRGLDRVSARLQDLYGATFSSYVSKTTQQHLMTLRGGVVAPEFLPDRTDVLANLLDLMSDLLRRPYLGSPRFDLELFERERRNLLRAIDSIADSKAQYADQRLMEEMFRGHALAIPSFGTRADVEAASHEDIAQVCRDVFDAAPALVYVVSPRSTTEVRKLVAKHLRLESRRPLARTNRRMPRPRERAQRVSEQESIAQGRIAMGFRVGDYRRGQDSFPGLLGDTILGGSAMSRLFKHVRERHSLAYSIGSTFETGTGTVYVSAGVDSASADRVVGMVKRQVAALGRKMVTAAELDVALASISKSLDSSWDSPDSLIGLHLASLLGVRRAADPEALMRCYRRVRPEQIADVFSRVRLDTVFVLEGSGEEAS